MTMQYRVPHRHAAGTAYGCYSATCMLVPTTAARAVTARKRVTSVQVPVQVLVPPMMIVVLDLFHGFLASSALVR